MQTSDHIYSIYHIGNKIQHRCGEHKTYGAETEKQQYKIQTRRHYACDQRNRLAEDKSFVCQNYGAEHIERHENCSVQRHQTHQSLQKYQLVRCQGTTVCPQMERAECPYNQNCHTNHRVYLDKKTENTPFALQISFCTILGKIADNRTSYTEIQQSDITHNRLCNSVNTILCLT